MNEEELLKAKTFRDTVSTVDKKGKRKWIYALKPKGKWTNYRKILSYFYLTIFFVMPFIKINGLPLILINFAKGRFVLFGKIFWPQDFFIFAFAMITTIFFVVLFTVIYGRLFCGWVCPQTVFMEMVFRPIEWLIEGTPTQQKKLNESPWNFNKIFRKTLKQIIFFSISFVIANLFLSYVVGVDELAKIIREPLSEHIGLFSGLMIFTLLFYAVFAFVRDLVCTTVCPYGRLQGVMFDKDTMQIAYDYKRGEPRGKHKKGTERTTGDCVDCKKCVQVCPTGIDIRDGLQMECVGCTACIDACNEVMDVMQYPKGLIRYASETEIQTGKKFKLNNRMKAYTVLMIILLTVLVFLIATRDSYKVILNRASGTTYMEMIENKVSNLYEMKIINKTIKNHNAIIKVENMKGANVRYIGKNSFTLEAEKVNSGNFFIDVEKSKIKNRIFELEIGIYVEGEKIETKEISFVAPNN